MIPRTIHQIWIGSPLPEHLAQYMATWIEHHPTWAHLLWDEAAIDALPMLNSNRALYDRAGEITSSVGQLRADIVRYEILHQLGGVYVDADFECRKPLDPLLDEHVEQAGAFAAWEVDGRWINNAIMGARPAHPLLGRLIAGLGANVSHVQRVEPGARPNKLSGPQYLTRIHREHRQVPLTIFDSALFYPYLWNELDRQGEAFPDAYAVHHWHNRRSARAARSR